MKRRTVGWASLWLAYLAVLAALVLAGCYTPTGLYRCRPDLERSTAGVDRGIGYSLCWQSMYQD